MTYSYPDGTLAAEGTVLEADPPRKLVTTFHATWDDDVSVDRAHRMTWEIFPAGGEQCRLVVTSDDFDGETATYRSFVGGMPVIASGLKTLVESETPESIAG